MANELSTAGVTVGFAIESVTGTRPELGYQRIPGVKSTPDLNPEPSSLQVTTLEDAEWHRYILGLKDPSGALPFTCNNTDEFQVAWYTLCELSDEAREDELATWFAINIPNLGKSFYISAIPSKLGVIGMEVDAVAEVQAYVSPNGIDGWQTAPTIPAVYITPIKTQKLTALNSPITLTPVLSEPLAIIDAVTSSDTNVATVTTDGEDVVITRVGAGKCDILVETNSDTNHSVGKTIIRVEST